MESVSEKDNVVKEDMSPEVSSREGLNLQKFFDDMRLLGEQVKSRDLSKPPFDYGDLSVTNYLLWLILGELMMLNDNVGEEDA